MNNRPNVTILLAEARGKTQSGGLDSFHSLNFGNYRMEGREPFGEVFVFNEDFLAPEKGTEISVSSHIEIFLIPIAGGLEMEFNNGGDLRYISAGEALHIVALPGNRIKLTNPYSSRQVCFIQIWLSSKTGGLSTFSYMQTGFDINDKNRFKPILTSNSGNTTVRLTKMELRQKRHYTPHHSDIFVFTVEGAFDFHDRLIQHKEGLILRQVSDELEFEALSQDAILLMIETRT
ncbi:MAG: hypothetical protein QM640_05875 [Niabella sp.]